MKKLSLLLALMMLFASVSIPAVAETTTDRFTPITLTDPAHELNIQWVAAEGEQIALSYDEKEIIEADGLKFKDLNANGKLDVYEDWRLDTATRTNDLINQMNLDEKIGALFHVNDGGAFSSLYPYTEEYLWSNEHTYIKDEVCYVPLYHSIISDNVTTYLRNENGTPEEIAFKSNTMQKIAESGRLGIPVVSSCDRSYNTWAGMVNMSNYAFGVADDTELLYNLVSQYAKEERALGIQVPLHTYGVEIGSWYGDEINNIIRMMTTEIRAYEDNGVNGCTKHYVARGGRSGYSAAKSEANLVESWKALWQAAVDAGTQQIMLNNGSFLNDCWVSYDKESLDVLRNMGYEGVIVTDWPMWIGLPSATGTTPDGRDLSAMSVGELYATIFNAGVDQIGCFFMVDSTEVTQEVLDTMYPGMQQPQWQSAIKEQIELGNITMETLDKHVFRVMKNKFDLGLFDNPFVDAAAALEICASEAYQAEAFPLVTIDDVYAARNENTNALEIELQTKSAVLLKNDNNLLPLKQGVKVYVDGSTADTVALDKAAIGAYTTVVETMEEADVIVARVSSLNDQSELIIDDAAYYNKPIVLVFQAGNNANEITAYEVENCDALLMTTYACTADHGSAMGNFFTSTLPSVLADMLFGVKEPGGNLVYEIAINSEDAAIENKELAYDAGVDDKTRLYMIGLVRQNTMVELPDNLGDVLYNPTFGMAYGKEADISVSLLTVPQVVSSVESVNSFGSKQVSTQQVNASPKAGEAFEISFLVENKGADGYTTVEVYANDQLVDSKFVSVNGGDFRVVSMDITLAAGEYALKVCDMVETITVVE